MDKERVHLIDPHVHLTPAKAYKRNGVRVESGVPHFDSPWSAPELARDYLNWLHEKIGLTAIFVTNHEDLSYALEFREESVQTGYQVSIVPGIEIEASYKGLDGQEKLCHILGIGLSTWDLQPGSPAPSVIERIKKLGGSAVIPHPSPDTWLGERFAAMPLWYLKNLLGDKMPIDAIQLNGLFPNNTPLFKPRLLEFMEQEAVGKVSVIWGSDAHAWWDIGCLATAIENISGDVYQDFLFALGKKKILEGRGGGQNPVSALVNLSNNTSWVPGALYSLFLRRR